MKLLLWTLIAFTSAAHLNLKINKPAANQFLKNYLKVVDAKGKRNHEEFTKEDEERSHELQEKFWNEDEEIEYDWEDVWMTV